MKRVRIVVAGVLGLALGVAADRLASRFVLPPPAQAPLVQAAPPSALAPAPAAAPGQEDPRAVYRVPLDDAPARGPKDALVTVVEFSDFECPFCRRAAPTLQQLAGIYGSKLRFVFRHNPLPMHANALPAALAAEEVRREKGDAAFWTVHDRLFAAQALDRGAIDAAAAAAGVSAAAVREAIDGSRHLDRIRRDQTLAGSLGASGTPTFYVNGRRLVGAQPIEAFRALVDEELGKAEALVRSGVAPADVYARATEKGATALAVVPGGAPPPAEAVTVPLRPDDPVRGPKVAPVTLVLFSDFQCPYCARLEPTLQQVVARYGSKVRIAWKHQPLPFHPNAMPAARAAEAAREAGKFWEMHDRLFANPQALSDATYLQYARELKLDLGRFQRSLTADAAAGRIRADQQLAGQVGASGTPTVFVNCRRIVGAQPVEAFQRLVDEELARADRLVKGGEKLDAAFYDKICAANVSGRLAAAP